VSRKRDEAFFRVRAAAQLGYAALNLSGCLPLYAIPAFQAFVAAGHVVFAVEPNSDQLYWLSHDSGNYPSFNVADERSLKRFLEGHGVNWINADQTGIKVKHDWNQAANQLLQIAPACREAIQALAHYAKGEAIDSTIQNSCNFKKLIDILETHGICSPASTKNRFDTHARKFASGGWLECAVFDAARKLQNSGLIQDAVCGLVIEKNGASAEWDVVFLANNNLHIVECKATASLGMDALFKLESLSRAVDAYSMVISLAEPTAGERKRADGMGINPAYPVAVQH
jgi:hypothetical protein